MKRIAGILFSVMVISNLSFGQGMKYKSNVFSKNQESTDSKSPFSFKVGYNISNVILSPEPLNMVTSKNSFHFGIVANDIKIDNHIGLQPELLYSMQGFKVGGLGNVGLHYVSLPLLLKLNMGSNASILVGPQISYLANARIGIGNDLFSVKYDGLFQKWDASVVGGLEYKVSDKLAIGGRYAMGINNINKNFTIGNNSFNDYFSLKNSTAQFYLTFSL